jgi:DNA-binding GntR family transcriptional regulator
MTSNQLARLLEQAIRDGKYRQGEKLPAEANLGKANGVSVTMVRDALAQLVGKGLVRKVRGAGTYVL